MFFCIERKKKPVPYEPSPVTTRNPSVLGNYDNPYNEQLTNMYKNMREQLIGKQKATDIDWYMAQLYKGEDRYRLASDKIQSLKNYHVPWEVIGVCHGLEASFDFSKQLLNGQSWKQRSTWVPKGYGPWESWSDSVVTAFDIKDTPQVWNIGNTLWFLEQYNGTGYRKYRNMDTPYLWSYSHFYTGGKYVSDGKFSKSAISRQVGCAVMLKRLGYKGQGAR